MMAIDTSYQARFVRRSYDTRSLNGGVPTTSTIELSASCLKLRIYLYMQRGSCKKNFRMRGQSEPKRNINR